MASDTEYINTDFDLASTKPFDTLHRELEKSCRVLHYTHGDDGHWRAIVESSHDDDSGNRNAEMDIAAILNAFENLSPMARAELDACYLRELNIGFDCWDTWSYVHRVPTAVVRSVANFNCSIAVTLYPMRNPDGTPKQRLIVSGVATGQAWLFVNVVRNVLCQGRQLPSTAPFPSTDIMPTRL